MKVLYITNVPSPYRVDFFNELGRYCDLTVLFETDRADDRDERWMHQNAEFYQAIYMKARFRKTDTAFCPEVIKLYHNIRADLLVVGGYSTPTGMYLIQYLRRYRIPFVLNCDGGLIKKDSWIKYRIKRFFISSASFWLSTGEACNQYLLYYGARRERIAVYPFTSIKESDVLKIPVSEAEKLNLRKKLSIDEKNIIISVGQFIYRKGYDILIEAMKHDTETGIYIIGGNPLPEYLELKDRYGMKNLHYVEFKAKEELREYYMAADVFVLPTREDIWGLVINEAMAYGLPVVTTKQCVAGQELIEADVNGYLVEAGNSCQLKEKIEQLFNDEDLRKMMQENNLNKIRDYTIENMARCHMKIFERILKEQRL